MNLLAFLAVAVTVGAWLGIRWADATQTVERDLTTYLLLTMPVEDCEREQ